MLSVRYNKIQIIKYNHGQYQLQQVSVQQCHHHGVYYNKEHNCKAPIQVLTSLTVIIKILKYSNAILH